MTMKLSVPPSPYWEESSDISIRELPKLFRWGAMVNQMLHYSNISLQADSETSEEFQEEFSYAIQFWNKPCHQPFPCPHGRQTLSKRQKKQPCGKHFGQSLCGHCMLNHFVSEKREDMDTYSSQEIADWYFSDDDDSDSEDEDIFYNKMQLQRTASGTLQFTQTYLETLQTGITANSAA